MQENSDLAAQETQIFRILSESAQSVQFVPPVSAKSRKRTNLDLFGSDDSLFANTKRSKLMEVEDPCCRCRKPLGAVIMKCASCSREFHGSCRTPDEGEPPEEPGSRWSCRLCALPASSLTADEMLAELDKLELGNSTRAMVVHMALRIRALDGGSDAGKPIKTVLPIGDKSLRQIKGKILKQLPGKTSLVVRAISKLDIASITAAASKFQEQNSQAVHSIFHCGLVECMEIRKDKFLAEIAEFTSKYCEIRGCDNHSALQR